MLTRDLILTKRGHEKRSEISTPPSKVTTMSAHPDSWRGQCQAGLADTGYEVEGGGSWLILAPSRHTVWPSDTKGKDNFLLVKGLRHQNSVQVFLIIDNGSA